MLKLLVWLIVQELMNLQIMVFVKNAIHLCKIVQNVHQKKHAHNAILVNFFFFEYY